MDLKNEKAKLAAIKFIRCADEKTSVINWNNIVRHFGNNSIMQEILIDSPYIPEESLNILINEKHLSPKLCLKLFSTRELSDSIIKLSIVPNIRITDIVNYLKECYDNKVEIPNQNLLHLSGIHNEDITLQCLKCISDDDLINDTMDIETPKEKHLTAIASNHFIAQNTRHRAFELGCDYLKIENPTEKMADDMCDSWMATVFDNIIDKNNKSEKMIQYVCLEQLTKLVRMNKMSTKKQLELAEKCENVISDGNSAGIMELYSALIQTTQSSEIVNFCYDSCHPQIKTLAICNEFMSKDVSKAVADTLVASLSRASGNDYIHTCSMISMLAKRTELSHFAYDNIMYNKITPIQIEIAKSPTTPISILKKLQKGRQNQQIVRLAEFNERVYNGGILYLDEFNKVLNAFKTEKNKDGVIAVDNIALIGRKECLDETLDILRDIAEKTTTPNLKKNILSYASQLEIYSNAFIEKQLTFLYEYNPKTNKTEPMYDMIPEMDDGFFTENLQKFSTPSLYLIENEIKYDYYIASDVQKHKMFDAKERLIEAINNEVSRRSKKRIESDLRQKISKDGEIDAIEI